MNRIPVTEDIKASEIGRRGRDAEQASPIPSVASKNWERHLDCGSPSPRNEKPQPHNGLPNPGRPGWEAVQQGLCLRETKGCGRPRRYGPQGRHTETHSLTNAGVAQGEGLN